MRVSIIIPAAVAAALSAAPAFARPLPNAVSSVAALVYRDFPSTENHEPPVTWRGHGLQKHGVERGAVARRPHGASVHDARELVLAELLARAIEESTDLYVRDLEERDYEEQTLWARAMSGSEKKKIQAALEVMKEREMSFAWGANWQKVHNANTSQLGGLKPGSRKDTAEPHHYWVGVFAGAGKNIQGNAIIQASFDHEPSSTEAVEGLEAALKAA